MWDVCTSHADYISCDVTSSDVDHVTLLHIIVVSPTLDEIGDVASTLLGLIPWKVFIVANVLARKFHNNLQNFRWKDAWLYVYVFRLKKLLSGTETMARSVSSRGLTFHTSNNHTIRIDLPGKFWPQHDGHWWILEHVMWCLFLGLFFLLKIPYNPIFIWLCHTMKEHLLIKILIAHIQTFPNNIISNYQFGT